MKTGTIIVQFLGPHWDWLWFPLPVSVQPQLPASSPGMLSCGHIDIGYLFYHFIVLDHVNLDYASCIFMTTPVFSTKAFHPVIQLLAGLCWSLIFVLSQFCI